MNSDNMTVIAVGTQIKGEMTFDQAVCIQGHFEGTIEAKGKLEVTEGASCRAEVQASEILVGGTIEGNIKAFERVTLNANARVKGNIIAEQLTTADGACLEGYLTVGPNVSPCESSDRSVS